ncbi:hypothetical protein LC609_21440 [Nostoc sp. XA013]|nr:hypothetical protein [Nostoc sp. XA013]
MKSKLGFHNYWQERSQAKLKTIFTNKCKGSIITSATRAKQESQRADCLTAQLRSLGIEPEA